MSLPARTLALNILRTHRASSDAEVLALALKALASGQKYLAYELLRAAPRALAAAKVKDIRRFAAGMTTWSDVDCFGCFVAGVAWRTGRISDKEIARLASSRDRWWRRAALVATVPLNAKSRGATSATGDATRTRIRLDAFSGFYLCFQPTRPTSTGRIDCGATRSRPLRPGAPG